MSPLFFVVHEARADFETATELADRVLTEKIEWLDETLLDSQREWIGEDQPAGRLTWRSIPSRANELGIRVHGHFDGEPGLPDAKAARRALAYVLRRHQRVDAVLLVRDVDDQGERRRGLEQARALSSSLTTVIIGVAIPERECWVLSGFDPENDEEERRLTAETQKLGFNPCLRSHELTAGKDNQATRSPKRVLAVLTGGAWERQRKCWQATPLAMLAERGSGNGLRDYLDEVRTFLVPLITGYQGKPGEP